MAKYMILSLPSTDSIPLPLQENQRLTVGYPEKSVTPEVGDHALIFHEKKKEILPSLVERPQASTSRFYPKSRTEANKN